MEINFDEFSFVLSEKTLRLIAIKGIQIIQDRTAESKDVSGQPFKPYSDRWFVRPANFLKKDASKVKALMDAEPSLLKEFTTKNKSLWAAIKGYDLYKKTFNSREYNGGKPNLRWTGEMMDGITVIDIDAKNSTIEIGFARTELAEQAFYVDSLRHFFELNDSELNDLAEFAIDEMEIID